MIILDEKHFSFTLKQNQSMGFMEAPEAKGHRWCNDTRENMLVWTLVSQTQR